MNPLLSGTIKIEIVVPADDCCERDFDAIEADIKSMAIHSDKAVTVKTNSASEPGDTISLAAGEIRMWMAGDPDARKLFTADVTELYITNTSGAPANVTIYIND